jgi:hypothetical protein
VSDNTWAESTITCNNAPQGGNALASSGKVVTGTWISTDVTASITGNGTYNLALAALSSTAINFASRESGTNVPQLIIETYLEDLKNDLVLIFLRFDRVRRKRNSLALKARGGQDCLRGMIECHKQVFPS